MATKSPYNSYDPSNLNEDWLTRTWRPIAAMVYLAICLFDFIIAPAFMGVHSLNSAQMATSLKGMDPTIAIAIIQNRTPWQPLTLQGSGLFHVAFGAILGVAAWTRGSAQIEYIRQQGESDRSPYTPSPDPVPAPAKPKPPKPPKKVPADPDAGDSGDSGSVDDPDK